MTTPNLVAVRPRVAGGEVRLDRVDKRNALSHALVDEVLDAFTSLRAGGAIGAVLAANGPVFTAGGDLADVNTDPVPSARLLDFLRTTDLFVVALVEGAVLGAGVAVVRSCPVAIGTPTATFALPEARLGNYPIPISYLDGTVNGRRAVEIGLRGDVVASEEAVAAGLLTELVDADEADAAVDGWMQLVEARPEVARQATRVWQREVSAPAHARSEWLRALVVDGVGA